MLLSLFLLIATPIHGDRILVEKSARRLTLLHHGRVVKRYAISLGSNPVGAKEREDDGKTPEGIYTIEFNFNPVTPFDFWLDDISFY